MGGEGGKELVAKKEKVRRGRGKGEGKETDQPSLQ